MSTPTITIGPDATVPLAAKLLALHGIKRLPVVDEDGKLIGIVSRADLLRLFLRDDDAIRREILDEVLRRALWIDPVTGTVPGVVGVVSQLTYEMDDDRLPLPPTRSFAP